MISNPPDPATGTAPHHQGRARGLYDEQLQRKQQEKALIKGGLPGFGPALFTLSAPILSEAAETAE
jgi:hypothetical protein